jgi:hypothetical protein
MMLLRSSSWHYRLGPDPDVDFCVWVIEQDGLPVPPFDRRPDGDGALRAAGLDAASWRRWFIRSIAAINERRDIVKKSVMEKADFARLRALEPAALWDGAPAVGERLTTLAEAYEDVMNERKDRVGERLMTLESDRRLWDDLAPYLSRLPPLNVITVCYPGPVRMVVPPQSVVLGVIDWRPDVATLSAEILAGAAALSETESVGHR